jgi:Kef-type K+ transport system membrane component KefB
VRGWGLCEETPLSVAFAILIVGPWLLSRGALALKLPGILGMLAFGFDYLTSVVGASILAAVSPAVVVPSMLHLKERGYTEVPTMLLAIVVTAPLGLLLIRGLGPRLLTRPETGVEGPATA